MQRTSEQTTGDTIPVTGGSDLPPKLVNAIAFEGDVPQDDLGSFIYWLLKLNAGKISLRLENSDIASMDDATKRLLIADIQKVLDIQPLLKTVL